MTVSFCNFYLRRLFSPSLLFLSIGLFFADSVAFSCPGGHPLAQHSLTTMKLTLDLGSQSPASLPLPLVYQLLFAPSSEAESPLNNALSLAMGPQDLRLEEARKILLRHLDRVETHLVFIDGIDNERGFQPERGESLQENWVFSLVIPSLSDHIYWIVIPKKSQTPESGYVYGFN